MTSDRIIALSVAVVVLPVLVGWVVFRVLIWRPAWNRRLARLVLRWRLVAPLQFPVPDGDIARKAESIRRRAEQIRRTAIDRRQELP